MERKFIYLRLLILLSSLCVLAACNTNIANTPVIGAATQQVTPQIPVVLSVKNISSLQQLEMWGKGRAQTLAWSADQKILAIGSSFGIYLYDAQTLKPVKFIYTGESANVIAISPDGKKIATGDKQIRIWDIATGQRLATLSGSVRGWLTSVAFSPNGSWIAAHGTDGEPGDPPSRFFVWDAVNWQVLYTRETIACGHGTSFTFSPNSQTIAYKVCGGVELINTLTGADVESFSLSTEIYSHNVIFSADGKNMIAGTDNNQISIIDIASQKVIRTINAGGNGSISLGLTPDGKTLLIAGVWDDRKKVWGTELWNIETGKFTYMLKGVEAHGPIRSDGLYLAAIVGDDVQLWDMETGQLAKTISWESVVSSITFGQLALNGETPKTILLAANGQGEIQLIDPQTKEIIRTLHLSDKPISSLAVHPNGHIIAVGWADDKVASISIYDLNTNKTISTIDVDNQPDRVGIWGLAFSVDGQDIAAKVSPYRQIERWEIASREKLPNPSQQTWFDAANIGADFQGHLIDVDYNDGHLEIQNRKDGKLLSTSLDVSETGICQEYQHIALSFDGRYFAIGCDLWTLPIWDLPQKKLAYNLSNHEPFVADGFKANITDIKFSPNGYLLITSGYDQTIRFWDASSGQLLRTVSDHTCTVTSLALSMDGRYLASTSCDGTLRLWGVQP